MTKPILATLLVFQHMTAGIYGLIFYELFQHEISMLRVLRADEVKRRIKRDARTFSLEFYGYLIENVFLIALLISSAKIDLVPAIGVGFSVEFMIKSIFQQFMLGLNFPRALNALIRAIRPSTRDIIG